MTFEDSRAGAKSSTILIGLVGRGILASKSPRLHEREAAAQQLDLSYRLFDFDDRGWADAQLGEVVHGLAASGYHGANVTFPFKQAIIPLLDEVSPAASAIGAVNTILFRDGRVVGHNTDAAGFAQGIEAYVPADRLGHVVQLGAGGAGSASAHALLDLGVGHLTIVEPDAGRRSALVGKLAARFGAGRVSGAETADLVAPAADGIVNTSPIGMAKLPGIPLDPRLLAHRPWVYDIIYLPERTELLAAAEACGCQTINGITMVIHQAAAAFQLFTGMAADPARMKQSISVR